MGRNTTILIIALQDTDKLYRPLTRIWAANMIELNHALGELVAEESELG
jgi:hypothetical protein